MATKTGTPLDGTDRKLIELLQRNALATAEQLARDVALSPSAITRRVRRLRNEGWIARDEAVVSAALREARLRALVFVQVQEHAEERGLAALRARLSACDEVQLLIDVTGSNDLALLVSARDMADFNGWTARLLENDPAVRRYETNVAKRVHKQTGFVPVLDD